MTTHSTESTITKFRDISAKGTRRSAAEWLGKKTKEKEMNGFPNYETWSAYHGLMTAMEPWCFDSLLEIFLYEEIQLRKEDMYLSYHVYELRYRDVVEFLGLSRKFTSEGIHFLDSGLDRKSLTLGILDRLITTEHLR